jgi:hypothetical protein|tara:strand:+ start:4244 stop:4570 length:327 start_codon:yes stop_codon:yes gene_type:complete
VPEKIHDIRHCINLTLMYISKRRRVAGNLLRMHRTPPAEFEHCVRDIITAAGHVIGMLQEISPNEKTTMGSNPTGDSGRDHRGRYIDAVGLLSSCPRTASLLGSHGET